MAGTLKDQRAAQLNTMLRRAEVIIRTGYGDRGGSIIPEKAKMLERDLASLTVAYLSNYIPAVLPPEQRKYAIALVATIIDLEIENSKDAPSSI